jgi:hypothetical protein
METGIVFLSEIIEVKNCCVSVCPSVFVGK